MAECILKSNELTVRISTQGAELHSILTASGQELLWQADPKVWARHAPVLFPIVGRLANDLLKHQDQSYPLSQHGFARDMEFELVSQSDDACLMRLTDNAETEKHFPFPFILEIAYTLKHSCLEVSYCIANPENTKPLYTSIGAHPAFVWPLKSDAPKTDHVIEFEQDEPNPIRRLNGGLLKQASSPTPVCGRKMQLQDELFEEDAVIFDQHRSSSVSYYGQGTPRITVSFEDFPHLGIWTKPGADFICIEPWQGHSSPEEFDGNFEDKPGVVKIEGKQQRRWSFTIDVAEG